MAKTAYSLANDRSMFVTTKNPIRLHNCCGHGSRVL